MQIDLTFSGIKEQSIGQGSSYLVWYLTSAFGSELVGGTSEIKEKEVKT